MVSSVVTAWGLFSTHTQLSVLRVLSDIMAFMHWDVAQALLCREQACAVECMEQWRAVFEQQHLHIGGMGCVMHWLASVEHEGGTVTKTEAVKTCLV